MNYFSKKTFLLFLLLAASTNFSQWTTVYQSSSNLRSITFVNSNTGFACGFNDFIIKTTNCGITWINQATGFSNGLLGITFLNENQGYACGNLGKIFKTTNGGLNWITQTSGTAESLGSPSFIDENNGEIIFISGSSNLLRTTNGGQNWTTQSINLGGDYSCLKYISQSITLVGGLHTLILTTNSGQNWIDRSNALGLDGSCYDIKTDNNNNIWAVGWNSLLLKSTDFGFTWVNTYSGIDNTYFLGIQFCNTNTGYACGMVGKIAKTTNGGLNWISQNSGTTDFIYKLSFVDVNTGFAAAEFRILKTTNGGNPIGVKPISGKVPDEFSLSQNYPNPFNPTTKIMFNIPLSKGVPEGRGVLTKLIIYDILGREVATLVNENLQPNEYEVDWDASAYSSGVYFYKLETEFFSETKKMVLMK